MRKNKYITRYGCVPLISLMLLLIVGFAHAQHNLLFEQFTGTTFPPTGWTRFNFDGGNRQWERQTNFYNSSPACAWIKFEPGARVSDDWLVTPRIGPIEATDSLVLYCRSYSPAYSETLFARFSKHPNVNDTSQYNHVTTVSTIITTSNRFQRYSISLSAHIGDTIYIAFQYSPKNPAPNTKFGVAIDDIAVGFPTPRQDVGVTKILAPIGTVDSGTVVTPACSVYNYGTYPESYRVRMKIGTFYNDTVLVSNHGVDTFKYVTFPSWTAIQRGTHAVICSTQLVGDVDIDNDMQTGSVSVRVSDVGVTGILQPTGNVDSTATIMPQAKVKNFGNRPETFDVTFTISSAKWASTKTISNLLANEERTIDFDLWTVGPRGNYTTNCATALTGDMVPSNNSLNGSFAVIAYDLNVSVVGNGTVTKNPNQVSYAPGTEVTLTANPATGWHFLSWSGDIISTTSPVIVTMNAHKNITANFGIDTFEIVSSATSGGAIAPLGTTIVTYGGNQSYTITPSTGYHIIDVLVDGGSVGPVGSYDFTNVIIGHSIHAVFGIDSFTITATAVGGGTITPPGSVVVTFGSDQSFAINPNTGYHIDSVIADGVNIGTPTSYTFYSVTTNHTIVGYFSINTYTITASAVGTGTVNPMGVTTVSYGGSQAYTVIPGTGHHIDSVKVDGVNQGAITNYNFTSVQANHTIVGYFSINVYTITASAVGTGTVNPMGITTVSYGGSQAYTVTQGIGHHIDSVKVDGVNQGAITNYNFTNVQTNHTIVGYFSINTYTITASAVGTGTVNPMGVTTVSYGGSQAYTVAPGIGHHIDSVKVDGVNQGVITNYDFTNVAANHTIIGYFSINTYTITATAYGNGTITPAGVTVVNYGGSQAYLITPNTGNAIDSVLVNGVYQGIITNYNFTDVTANHTISAFFSGLFYTITSTAYGNGTIIPKGVTVVNYGGSQAYTISPNTGYHIDSVRVDGVNLGVVTNYNFTSVTANHTIDAYFSINTYKIIATAGANGSITPSGAVIVTYGSDQNFIISPDIGYHILDVMVDGGSVGAVTNYNFINVTANHSIIATFGIDSFTITSSAGPNGTISPVGITYVTYNGNQSYTITPNMGYHVSDVLVDGNTVGAITNYTFNNIIANHTITASFAINTYDLNVAIVGNGEVTKEPNLPEYEYGTQVTLTAIPVTGWIFTGWSGDIVSNDNPLIVTMDSDKNITATFTINTYDLNITVIGNGEVTKEPNLPEYEYGTQVTLTALPAEGWTFTGWSGDVVSADNPILVTMDNDKNITATFTVITYDLNVTVIGNGEVTRDPNLPEYEYGTQVTLTAIPVTGWTFTGWSGDVVSTDNPILVTMDNDKNITATFTVNTYTLTVATIGNGTVTIEPDLPVYEHGTYVTLTAVPDSGWALGRWSGSATGGANPLLIVMDGNKSITATFVLRLWAQREPIPSHDPKPNKFVKDGGSIVAVNNQKNNVALYAFRGNRSREFYKYDSTWMQVESIPYGLKPTDPTKINKKKIGKGASLSYDGNNIIYATKGNGTKEFWAYDIAVDTWIPKAFVPVPKALKSGTSIACYEGKVYLLAGSQRKIDSTNFYIYDPATDNWTPLSAAPAYDNKPYKDGSCIVPMDGMIYALKGSGKYNYFMRYTIASPGWVLLDTVPRCYPANLISNPKKSKVKIGGAMTLAHDEIYIIKGGNNNEFWRYTTGTPGVWTAMDTIPKGLRGRKGCPANGASMAFCDDTIYLLKGNNSSEFWRYGPILGKSGTQPTTAKIPEAITNNSLMNTSLSTLPIANLNISLDRTTQSATIHYTVELSGKVTIKVYDTNGRLVENINDRYLSSGTYAATLSLMKFAKGVYFLKYNDITKETEVKFVVR